MIEISGTLMSLSHSIRVVFGCMRFLELDRGGTTTYILVRNAKLEEWHGSLDIHGYYTFRCLHAMYIDLEDRQINLFSTCSNTTYSKARTLPDNHLDGLHMEMGPNVLSCKAVVSKVLNEDAGIFLINDCMKLYITFLKGFTGEIWNESNARNVHKCLMIGDTIRIFRCHYWKEEKQVVLVCCGQTCIVNESRKFILMPYTSEQLPGIAAVVNIHNLTYKGLIWLLKLWEQWLSIVPSSVSTSGHSTQENSEVASQMIVLLNEAKTRKIMKETKPRSQGTEFLDPYHDCHIFQDFEPPFELVSLKDVLNECAQNTWRTSDMSLYAPRSKWSDFWSYYVSPESISCAMLVGKLGGGLGGTLQLVQKEATIDLVLIGNAGMALSKYQTTVALFNFHIVKEKFQMRVNDAEHHKTYIVVRASDLVVLEAEGNVSLKKEADSDVPSYKCKLLSKTALVVPHFWNGDASLSKVSQCKFFVGRTMISKIGYKGQTQTWQKFMKFSGKHAELYPLLEVGDECELKIPPKLDAEAILRRSHTFNWMKCISECQSTECLFIPPEIVMQKMSSVEMKWGEVSVEKVKSQGDKLELITITGTVMCKTFVVPRFDSENSKLTQSICMDYHIGIPQSKQMKLLIKDESECMLWLYISCATNYFTKTYPLFVVPGIKIIATDVKRIVAKTSDKVYLTSSNFTHIIPLSMCVSENTSTLDEDTSREPMYVILRDVPLPSHPFVIFARIQPITRATLKVVCDKCNTVMEQPSDCCGNCFSQSSGIIDTSVEVVVDDGTSSTYIVLKDIKHFAILLNFSRKQYNKLCDLVLSKCLHLNYDFFKPQDDKPTSKYFRMLIKKAKRAHSYKFTCRGQKCPPHLCLDVSMLKPTLSVKLLCKDDAEKVADV